MAKLPPRKKRGLSFKNTVITALSSSSSQSVAKPHRNLASKKPSLRRSSRLQAPTPEEMCYIKRLPVELLLMVFLAVGEAEHGVRERACPYVRTVLKMAHVCRDWKELVMNIPPVSWKTIFTYLIDSCDREKVEQLEECPIKPKHLAQFVQRYQIKHLGCLATDSVPCKTFDLSLHQRSRGPQDLPLLHLNLNGLNHLSAQFLLTNRFPNLISLTIGRAQISHITQIVGVLRHPITCDELRLDDTTYRSENAVAQNQYSACVLYALYFLHEWIHFHSLVIETSNPAASLEIGDVSTWICESSQRDHVREFQSTRMASPSVKFLEINGFSAMKLRGIKIGLQHLRYLNLTIVEFEHGKEATQSWVPKKWWENFWCFFFQAGESLQIIEIAGIKRKSDWLDFVKARKLLSEMCVICLDAATPEDVLGALETADPTAFIVRNLTVVILHKEKKVHVITMRGG